MRPDKKYVCRNCGKESEPNDPLIPPCPDAPGASNWEHDLREVEE